MDFYRELGDLFGVPLAVYNRWSGFKALRARWTDHISTSLTRPVLILDEAQEALSPVFTELRTLACKDLDTRQLLCVVLAGDARLVERLRSPELLPLGSRIRRRLVLDYATGDVLLACLDHLLEAAGNPSLMTTELKATLADHAAGNYRVLMNLSDELLAVALDRELPRLVWESSHERPPHPMHEALAMGSFPDFVDLDAHSGGELCGEPGALLLPGRRVGRFAGDVAQNGRQGSQGCPRIEVTPRCCACDAHTLSPSRGRC